MLRGEEGKRRKKVLRTISLILGVANNGGKGGKRGEKGNGTVPRGRIFSQLRKWADLLGGKGAERKGVSCVWGVFLYSYPKYHAYMRRRTLGRRKKKGKRGKENCGVNAERETLTIVREQKERADRVIVLDLIR